MKFQENRGGSHSLCSMKRTMESADDETFTVFKDSNRLVADGVNAFVASLLPGEMLSVWGEFTASCVSGSVEVTGWKLTQQAETIRAPLSQAAVSFLCPHSALTKSDASGRGVGGVVRFEKAGGFYCGDHTLLPQWLIVAKESDAIQVFASAWQRALDQAGNGRVLICGSRGVGKSTLFRFAVNRLLSAGRKVCIVDTDPGQSELGTPGSLVVGEATFPLLSAGFCAGFSRTLKGLSVIGFPGKSPDRDLELFSASVGRLARAIPKDAHHVIINTPGWISGLGLETLCNTYEVMQCGIALQLLDPQSTPISLGQNALVVPLASRTFIPCPRSFSASSMRDWKMCEYFFGCPVVRLPLENVCVALYDGAEVPDHLVLMTLLETVVVLESAPSYAGREGWFCPTLPTDGTLIGLAFVRSVILDGTEGPVFQLQTPVKEFKSVNVLSRMCHETPTTLKSPFYSENPSINKSKHYANQPMTGSKYVLRNKDV